MPGTMSSMSYSQNYMQARLGHQELMFDVGQTADGAFAVDPRQAIVSWNAAAEELLGYGEEEVLGRKCSSILGICGQQKVSCDGGRCHAFANTIRGCLTPNTEVVVSTKSGHLRRLSMSVIAAHSTSGEMHVVHLFHDVTQHSRSHPEAQAGSDLVQSPPMNGDEVGRSSSKGQIPLQLTHREHEVLRLLAAGCTTADIATVLSISPITVRNHITKVIEKLEVKTRLQAVVAASRLGLI
jgi:PAS domain S-box-containing protein